MWIDNQGRCVSNAMYHLLRASLLAAVTRDTSADLLMYAPDVWRHVLEKVCSLVKNNGHKFSGIIPSIDVPRIGYFVTFWEGVEDKPEWMAQVCKTLKKTK